MIKVASGFWLWWLNATHADAWTSYWRVIYVRPGCENDPGLAVHERTHLAQIERDGRFLFAIKYTYYGLRYGYLQNPYEIEANLNQRKVDQA